MDSANHGILLFLLLPLVAIVGLALNLFIRARGGRSFHLRLKGFGIDLTVETKGEDKEDRDIRKAKDIQVD